MDRPQLIESKRGKLQLFDQGFSLYKNKTQKNKHYFRCTITRCTASAVICGNLEDGVFEVVFHHVHKHQHETTPCSSLIKDFLAKFKAECGEKLDVPVQRIFEDLKISFVSNLDATQKSKLIEALPSMRAALMVGYRARGKDFSNLPQTLVEVDMGERFIQTLDGD